MTRSEKAAREYVAASNRGDYEAVAALFHESAEWIPISPIEPRRGRAAIRDRYVNEIQPMHVRIVNDRYIANQNECAAEFEVQHPEQGLVPLVDVFTVNDAGEITRLAVYGR